MVTTIYIDVLFIENLIIDTFILYLTSIASNRKFNILRGVIGGCVGSLYMCALFFSEFSFIENIAFKFIIIVSMIFLTFKVDKLREFNKLIIIYMIMNFILAGCIYFVNSLFSTGKFRNGVYYMKTTVFSIIVGGIVIIALGKMFFYIIKKNIMSKELNKELILVYCNKKIKLNTFLDTGNTLIDPITHTSVVVVSKNKIEKFINTKNISKIKNFRLIPCRTVTDKYELLYGFKPDKFIFNNRQINAIVAISKENLSDEYDAIINPLTLV